MRVDNAYLNSEYFLHGILIEPGIFPCFTNSSGFLTSINAIDLSARPDFTSSYSMTMFTLRPASFGEKRWARIVVA